MSLLPPEHELRAKIERRDAEIAKLREELVAKDAEIGKMRKGELEWTAMNAEYAKGKGAMVEATGAGYLLEFMGELVASTFEHQGAENAIGGEVRFEGNHKRLGPWEITARRLEGKHPLVLFGEQRDRAESAERKLADAIGLLRDAAEQCHGNAERRGLVARIDAFLEGATQ